jgi:hypothetical protein
MGQILLPLKSPVPNRYLAYYHFREKNIHYSIKNTDTCSVDPLLHDPQLRCKVRKIANIRPNHERHFGFLNLSSIFEDKQNNKTIFKK